MNQQVYNILIIAGETERERGNIVNLVKKLNDLEWSLEKGGVYSIADKLASVQLAIVTRFFALNIQHADLSKKMTVLGELSDIIPLIEEQEKKIVEGGKVNILPYYLLSWWVQDAVKKKELVETVNHFKKEKIRTLSRRMRNGN